MYLPMNYHEINVKAGTYSPSEIQTCNNRTFEYWERSLFQKLCSIITLNGLDDSWTGEVKNFLQFCLFRYGFVGVFDIPQVGFSFNPVTLNGYDFYYQPSKFTLANPYLKGSIPDFTIGVDSELLRLTPDYCGIWDIIRYHAERLSMIDRAIDMQIDTATYPYILSGRTKAGAELLKKVFDEKSKGKPLIVVDDKDFLDKGADTLNSSDTVHLEFLDLNVKDRYILDQLIMDRDSILNSFNVEIGIPTVPYQKKERMVQNEADSKKTESLSRCTTWVECLNDSMDKVNKMFNKNMSAELTFEDGGVTNEQCKTDTTGDV